MLTKTNTLPLNEQTIHQINSRLYEKLMNINQYLNKVFITQYEPYIITKEDIKSFHSILSYINNTLTIESMGYFMFYEHFDTNSIDKKCQIILTKFFFMTTWFTYVLISEFSINEHNLIQLLIKALKKFFLKGILLKNDIIAILKFQLLFSMIDKESVMNDNDTIDFYTINNIEVIYGINKLLISFHYDLLTKDQIKQFNEIVCETFIFVNENIMKNNDNIVLMSHSRKIFVLMEILKIDGIITKAIDIVIKTLLMIYSFRFKMKFLYKSIDDLFTNDLWDSNVRFISLEMRLLKELLIKEEKIVKQNDGIIIKKGFYYRNNNINSGIVSSSFTFPNNGYSLVISFNLIISNSHKKLYTIVSIDNQVSIYVLNSRLMISFGEVSKSTFQIEQNHSYILWLFHKDNNAIIYLNEERMQIDKVKYPSFKDKASIYLGHCPINRDNFTGEIGTFILFNEYYTEKSIQSCLINLKSQYEDIIIINYNDQRLEKLSENQRNPFLSNNLSKNIEIIISNQSICKFNYDHEKIKTSLMVYKTNYFNNLNQKTFTIKNIDYFNKEICLNEMIKHDGLMFLELNIAYLINYITNNDTFNNDLILQCYSDIVEVFLLHLKQSALHNDNNNNNLHKEIDNCFRSFKQLNQLLNDNKGVKLSLGVFCSFFNNFDYLLQTNLFFEHSDFFMNYSYYDNRTLISLFTFIDYQMHIYPMKFFTINFLQLILSFNKIFKSTQLNNMTKTAYKDFIRNYIMLCIRNKNYKNIVVCYIEKILSIKISYEDENQRKRNNTRITKDDNRKSLETNAMIYQEDNESLMMKSIIINDANVVLLYQYMKILYRSIKTHDDYKMLLWIIHEEYDYNKNTIKDHLFSFLINIFHITDNIYQSITFDSNDNNKKTYYHMEILKSYCIRLLDDFIYRSLDVDINKLHFDNPPKKSKETKHKKDKEEKSIVNHIFPFLNSSTFTPSRYTFRSFFLTIFTYDENNQTKINFIKQSNSIPFNQIKSNSFDKIAYEIIHLFTKITSIGITTSQTNKQYQYEEGIHLIMSLYDLLYTFIQGILSKYKEQSPTERMTSQKFMRDLFYSKSLCYMMYIALFSSEYFIYDKRVVDDRNEIDLYKTFKEKTKNDLYDIINNTMIMINNPFYILLLCNIYFKYDEDDFVITAISKMITALQQSKESIGNSSNSTKMTKELNHKNLVILIYTITFYEKKRAFLFKNTLYVKDIILYLLTLHSKSVIVYMKSLFPIDILYNDIMITNTVPTAATTDITNNNTITMLTNTVKGVRNTKMIIEMIFEIYFELYKEKNNYNETIKEGLLESLIFELLMKKAGGLVKKENNTMCYLIDLQDLKQRKSKNCLEVKQEQIKQLRIYFTSKTIEEYEGSVTLFFLIKLIIHIRATKNEEMISILMLIAEQLFKETDLLYKKKGRNLLAAKNYIEHPLYTEFKKYFQEMALMNNPSIFKIENFNSILDSKSDDVYHFINNNNSSSIYNHIIIKPVCKSRSRVSIATSSNYTDDNTHFYNINIDHPYTNPNRQYPFKSTDNLSNYSSQGIKKTLSFISPIKNKSFLGLNKLANAIINPDHFQSNNILIEKQKNKSSISIISNQPILNEVFSFKHDFIKKTFSVYFTSLLSYDPIFVNMNHLYSDSFKNDIKNIENYTLDYPTKMKNMTCHNYTRFFLERDFKFWKRNSLKYSHKFLINSTERFDLDKIKKTSLTIPKFSKCTMENNNNIGEEGIEFNCEMITISGGNYGKLIMYQNAICFKSNTSEPDLRKYDNSDLWNNNESSSPLDYVLCSCESDWDFSNKFITLFYRDIEEVLNRKYIHMWIAIEIFMKDGQSYFFNLFNILSHRKLLQYLQFNQVPTIKNLQEYFIERKYTEQWVNHLLPTYDYLLLLNKFSSRSYNDVTQYPIFPWIHLGNSTQSQSELEQRDLSLPISLQTPQKRKEYLQNDLSSFKGIKREHCSHYSTSAFVCFYLMRINPFTSYMLKLQSNRFDDPNRQFAVLNDVLLLCKSFKENREPVPELFSSPDYFYNYNRNDYGVQDLSQLSSMDISDYHRVHNVSFEPWAKDANNYTYKMRLMLNNDFQVNQHINEWIDYIFGCMQYSNPNGDCLRNFSKFSYEQLWDFNKKINDVKKFNSNENIEEGYQEIKNCIAHVLNFGQCPYQLFKEKHPLKKSILLSIATPNNNKIEKDNTVEHFTILSSNKFMLDANRSTNSINNNNYIVYFFISSYDNNLLYCLTSQHDLKIYTKTTLEKTIHNPLCHHHFKFFPKIHIDSNTKTFLYKPKFIFCELTEHNLIFVRYLDNSMKVYFNSSQIEIALESFITAIIPIKDNEFITGHETGEIFLWKIISNPFISLTKISRIQSNKGGITAMLYNYKMNILITADNNNVVIRNYYTLEYITFIKPSKIYGKRVIVIDMKLSPYDQLYVMCYTEDDSDKMYALMGYTMNGMYFGKVEGCFNNYDFASNGNLICGYLKENIIRIFHCVTFKEVYKKVIVNLENAELIDYFYYDSIEMIFYFSYRKNLKSNIEIVKIDNPFETPYFCDIIIDK